MSSKKITQVGLASLLVLLFGLAIYFSIGQTENPFIADTSKPVSETDREREAQTPNTGPLSDGQVGPGSDAGVVGGVERHRSDVTAGDAPAEPSDEDEAVDPMDRYGVNPTLDLDQPNPQMLAAVEAIRTGTHPERITTVVPSRPYDNERFETDEAYRDDYMSTAEPARVFDTAN